MLGKDKAKKRKSKLLRNSQVHLTPPLNCCALVHTGMKMTGKRIVIVGGGVAGVELASRLGRSLGRSGQARITLVDRSLSHFWKPVLHTFAAGTARASKQKVSFLAQARSNGFTFHPGLLVAVDRQVRQVVLAPFNADVGADHIQESSRLEYDLLVLAIGSRANDFGTPGVALNCIMMDDLSDAEALRDRLRTQMFTTIQTGAELRVAIVGGGPTGVELAAELRRAATLMANYGGSELPGKLKVVLIQGGARLLPTFPESIAHAAAKTLADIGVDVRLHAAVTGADETGFLLKEGGRIDADVMVWAAGVKAPDVLASMEGVERTKTGQLLVKPTLQTTQDERILALGDCASLWDPPTERPIPATAQVAHQQARHLSRHLARHLHDIDALPAFHYREEGSLVSLADYNGWGTMGRYTFGGGWLHGLSARFAHELLFWQHQFGLRGVMRGSVEWVMNRLDKLVNPPVELD